MVKSFVIALTRCSRFLTDLGPVLFTVNCTDQYSVECFDEKDFLADLLGVNENISLNVE